MYKEDQIDVLGVFAYADLLTHTYTFTYTSIRIHKLIYNFFFVDIDFHF